MQYRLLGILSAIHVSELDESVNFNLRKLSSPDPMVEVSVIFTPGSGSSRWRDIQSFIKILSHFRDSVWLTFYRYSM